MSIYDVNVCSVVLMYVVVMDTSRRCWSSDHWHRFQGSMDLCVCLTATRFVLFRTTAYLSSLDPFLFDGFLLHNIQYACSYIYRQYIRHPQNACINGGNS
eukprot:214636_1